MDEDHIGNTVKQAVAEFLSVPVEQVDERTVVTFDDYEGRGRLENMIFQKLGFSVGFGYEKQVAVSKIISDHNSLYGAACHGI